MYAIATKSFYMPAGTLTNKQGRKLTKRDDHFICTGEQFLVDGFGNVLIHEATGRKFNISNVKPESFKMFDEKQKCPYCALGYPKGDQPDIFVRADPNQHVINGGMIVEILYCQAV